MHPKIRRHKDSFRDAFSGLVWSFRTQPNFKIHLALSLLSLWGCYFFGLTRTEVIMIAFSIVLGFAGEMINTSIEAMTDLITDKYHQQAKIAKDVAAGMMLVIASGAFFIAVLIFLPYIGEYLGI